MEELFNILSEGKAHVRVKMDAADLKAFSDELIRRAKDELGSMVEAARKERMLSKTEVKELFGVCDATLWPLGQERHPQACQDRQQGALSRV